MSFTSTRSRPGPSEPYEAKIVDNNATRFKEKGVELEVVIDGKKEKAFVSFKELEAHGISGPSALVELRAIRSAIERKN